MLHTQIYSAGSGVLLLSKIYLRKTKQKTSPRKPKFGWVVLYPPSPTLTNLCWDICTRVWCHRAILHISDMMVHKVQCGVKASWGSQGFWLWLFLFSYQIWYDNDQIKLTCSTLKILFSVAEIFYSLMEFVQVRRVARCKHKMHNDRVTVHTLFKFPIML